MTNGWLRTTVPVAVTNNVVVTAGAGQLDLTEDLQCGGSLTITNGADLYVYSAATNGGAPDYGGAVHETSLVRGYERVAASRRGASSPTAQNPLGTRACPCYARPGRLRTAHIRGRQS